MKLWKYGWFGISAWVLVSLISTSIAVGQFQLEDLMSIGPVADTMSKSLGNHGWNRLAQTSKTLSAIRNAHLDEVELNTRRSLSQLEKSCKNDRLAMLLNEFMELDEIFNDYTTRATIPHFLREEECFTGFLRLCAADPKRVFLRGYLVISQDEINKLDATTFNRLEILTKACSVHLVSDSSYVLWMAQQKHFQTFMQNIKQLTFRNHLRFTQRDASYGPEMVKLVSLKKLAIFVRDTKLWNALPDLIPVGVIGIVIGPNFTADEAESYLTRIHDVVAKITSYEGLVNIGIFSILPKNLKTLNIRSSFVDVETPPPKDLITAISKFTTLDTLLLNYLFVKRIWQHEMIKHAPKTIRKLFVGPSQSLSDETLCSFKNLRYFVCMSCGWRTLNSKILQDNLEVLEIRGTYMTNLIDNRRNTMLKNYKKLHTLRLVKFNVNEKLFAEVLASIPPTLKKIVMIANEIKHNHHDESPPEKPAISLSPKLQLESIRLIQNKFQGLVVIDMLASIIMNSKNFKFLRAIWNTVEGDNLSLLLSRLPRTATAVVSTK
ncbi:hypothetical protein MP638_002971 [Amoeboaphelidium occidentale]|nr:hypothetical protein MP638_002971 [Amoeboaphelidium occidentale]